MSKGPGIIQRAIEGEFLARPDDAMSLTELMTSAFPSIQEFEKKHRVAAARAAGAVCERVGWSWMHSAAWGRASIYFNKRSVQSYALAKVRKDHPDRTLEDCRSALAGETWIGNSVSKIREWMRPGEAYDLHVQLFRAEMDGDEETVASLRMTIDARYSRAMAKLGA